MAMNKESLRFLCLFYLSTTTFLSLCVARNPRQFKNTVHFQSAKQQRIQQTESVRRLDEIQYPSADPYGSGSPLQPYNEMGPSASPQENPLYCIYPPFTPMPPSTTVPTPVFPILTPPTSPSITPSPPGYSYPSPPEYAPNPPEYIPSPPVNVPSPPEYEPSPPSTVPSPPEYEPSPPSIVPSPGAEPGPPIILPSPQGYEPSPPSITPSPPEYVFSPPSFMPSPPEYTLNPPSSNVPSPPEYTLNPPLSNVPNPPEYTLNPPSGNVPSTPEYLPAPPRFEPGTPYFLPPVIYPPPTAPPSPSRGTSYTRWCVAKPTVPDPIIQEAMNYACGSGADCDPIQPNGSCYLPDTVISHASYAFNSYWQRTKAAGSTCDFGGTAMLVTEDPSYDGCHFTLYS